MCTIVQLYRYGHNFGQTDTVTLSIQACGIRYLELGGLQFEVFHLFLEDPRSLFLLRELVLCVFQLCHQRIVPAATCVYVCVCV